MKGQVRITVEKEDAQGNILSSTKVVDPQLLQQVLKQKEYLGYHFSEAVTEVFGDGMR